MQVTVLGATGKVGQHVVRLLTADGHTVRALVHRPSNIFQNNAAVTIVNGDVHNPADIKRALAGSEAVISTLGSWGTPSKDILASAMAAVIPAMEQKPTQRVITLTGSAARADGDTITTGNKIMHRLFGIIAPKILQDGEAHLELLAASNLTWTTLRASIITNGQAGSYELNATLPKAWETISRQTVAQALVDQLHDTTLVRQAPHIHAT